MTEEQQNTREKEINRYIVLGNEQYKSGDIDSAKASYRKITELVNGDIGLYNLIGKKLKEVSAFDLAEAFYEEVTKLTPDYPDAYWDVGYINIKSLGNPNKGIIYINKYMQKTKPNADLYRIIAMLFMENRNYKKQIRYLKKSIKLKNNELCTIRSLAFAYSKIENYKKAIETFERLFELGGNPNDYLAYSTRKLRIKDFKTGFLHYESRFTADCGSIYYPVKENLKWEGQPIPDKTLLIQYEQGFGDNILFSRYIEQVKPLVGKIILRIQNELFELFNENFSGIEIVPKKTQIEDLCFDYHISMLSLPYVLNASFEKIPEAKGYLRANKAKIAEYKRKYFNNDCYKIGISWEGSENGIKYRNIPLKTFYNLAKLKNVKVYSFQKGSAQDHLKKLPKGVEIIDLGSTFNNYSDTAAAIENTDLMICGDNCVLNLSGALNHRALLLLPQKNDWRWFTETENSPWYDSVKLIKKTKEKQTWTSLLNEILIREKIFDNE